MVQRAPARRYRPSCLKSMATRRKHRGQGRSGEVRGEPGGVENVCDGNVLRVALRRRVGRTRGVGGVLLADVVAGVGVEDV